MTQVLGHANFGVPGVKELLCEAKSGVGAVWPRPGKGPGCSWNHVGREEGACLTCASLSSHRATSVCVCVCVCVVVVALCVWCMCVWSWMSLE